MVTDVCVCVIVCGYLFNYYMFKQHFYANPVNSRHDEMFTVVDFV